jgi:hypothetical protein
VLDQFGHHETCRVARDGKAEALRARNHGGVDADHFPERGDEWASGIAGVQRGVGLDHVLDESAGAAAERAAERRHDSGRDRGLEAERVADRDRDLAASEQLGIAEPRERQSVARGTQERQIRIGIVT